MIIASMVGERAQRFQIVRRKAGLWNEKSRNYGPLSRRRNGLIPNPTGLLGSSTRRTHHTAKRAEKFMERARQKIQEVIQERKRLLEKAQAQTESRSATDKSQYILAIGGVAAGLTIAVIVWLATTIMRTDHIAMSATDSAIVIHKGAISKLDENIARLNGRLESLTKSVSNLEARLIHLVRLTDSIAKTETQHATSFPQQLPESTASRSPQITTEAGREFVPTHIAKARVNLRPAASLNTTPVTVLDAGTKVRYIRESDGWYFVNTPSHGKGWCSSEYLAPLSPTQHKSSTK
jgi:hypothetical protein